MAIRKRDYNRGSGVRTKQYPVNISAQEYSELEELREKLSWKWGRDVSRGRFIMLMYRRTKRIIENDTTDDFCEGLESEIDRIIGELESLKDRVKQMRESGISKEGDEDGER